MSKSNTGPINGGERPGDRAAMDRVVKRMIGDGVDVKTAQREARESMVRTDRQLREQKKR